MTVRCCLRVGWNRQLAQPPTCGNDDYAVSLALASDNYQLMRRIYQLQSLANSPFNDHRYTLTYNSGYILPNILCKRASAFAFPHELL